MFGYSRNYSLKEIKRKKLNFSVSGRGVLAKAITVPYYANDGDPGYCWLSSAMSITKTLKPSFNTSIVNAHSFIHGLSHSLYSCPSGTMEEAYDVIAFYANKTGYIDYYNLNAAYAMSSINSDIPVFMTLFKWLPDGSSLGHSTVISGYIYNSDSGQFTYIIRDSIYSNYVYQVSNYTDSPVYYSLNSSISLQWVGAIYGWH